MDSKNGFEHFSTVFCIQGKNIYFLIKRPLMASVYDQQIFYQQNAQVKPKERFS